MNIYSEAIEQKYAALSWSRRAAGGFEVGNTYRQSFGRYERWALQHAEAYWWSTGIADAVFQSAMSLPDDTCVSSERLGSVNKCGWMWFEHDRHIDGFEPFRGILWFMDRFQDGQPCIVVTTYGPRDRSEPEALETIHIFDKKSLGEIDAELTESHSADTLEKVATLGAEISPHASAGTKMIRFFTAAQLWVQQEILSVTTQPAERHLKKRIQRAMGDAITDVRVVVLRRKSKSDDGYCPGPEDVEWSCRWIVSGHWRNQYYPSTGERVPMWIRPYVKGPEDKPLKTPTQAVFAVTR